MRIDNAEQRRIIARLILNQKMTFNQIWGKRGDSNKLAYHINRLVENKILSKSPSGYCLSAKGKALSALLDGDGKESPHPVMAYVVIISKAGKLLCQERLKEPFRGYVGFVSGNIKFGSSVIDCAIAGVKKQAGLDLKNPVIKGTEEIVTFEGDEALYHHMISIVTGGCEGELISEMPGKRNRWVTKKQLFDEKLFPKIGLDELLDPEVQSVRAFGHRYMKDGEFIGGKVIWREMIRKNPCPDRAVSNR